MSPAVELIGVRVEREGRPTVDDVTLAVQRGEVVGLVGANGSGKTTLLRAALGLAALARGEARLDGNLVARLSPARRAALAARRRAGSNSRESSSHTRPAIATTVTSTRLKSSRSDTSRRSSAAISSNGNR